MTLDDVRSCLTREGWHEHMTHDGVYLTKRVPDVRTCEGNADKDGVQFVVRLYRHCMTENVYESVEIDVTGEYAGHWYKLLAYSMTPSEFIHSRELVQRRLITAWGALALAQP